MFRFLVVVLVTMASAANAQSPVVLDADGNVLGWYGGNVNSEVRVILPSGYTIGINGRNGHVSGINQAISPDGSAGGYPPHYTTTDCTGDAYFNFEAGMGKFVYLLDNIGELYYVPPRAILGELVNVNVRSFKGLQNCQQINQTIPLHRLLPNDPAETGWDRGLQVPGPLKLGIQTVPSLPFSDSFENPQARLAPSSSTSVA